MSNDNVHDLLDYTGKHDKYSLILGGGGALKELLTNFISIDMNSGKYLVFSLI